MKHTSAPWIFNNDLSDYMGKPEAIPTAIMNTNREIICLLGEAEAKAANAHLIISAPDLLEVAKLQILLDNQGGFYHDGQEYFGREAQTILIHLRVKAIQKAEGKL